MAFLLQGCYVNQSDNDLFAELYKKNVESIVMIQAHKEDENTNSFGTAWFAGENKLVSVAHIFAGYDIEDDELTISISGNDHPHIDWTGLEVKYIDKMNDIVILEFTDHEKWKKFKEKENPKYLNVSKQAAKTGSDIWSIGHRLGLPYQFYRGAISSSEQYFIGYAVLTIADTELFQGDSGGPHMDRNGNVIGMTRGFFDHSTRFFSDRGINSSDAIELLVPVRIINKAITEYENGRKSAWIYRDKLFTFGNNENQDFIIKKTNDSRLAEYMGWKSGDHDFMILNDDGTVLHLNRRNFYTSFLVIAHDDPLSLVWTDKNGIQHEKTVILSDV